VLPGSVRFRHQALDGELVHHVVAAADVARVLPLLFADALNVVVESKKGVFVCPRLLSA
jgi:hypothetical protein